MIHASEEKIPTEKQGWVCLPSELYHQERKDTYNTIQQQTKPHLIQSDVYIGTLSPTRLTEMKHLYVQTRRKQLHQLHYEYLQVIVANFD